MSDEATAPDIGGIPQKIVEKFLERLSAEQVPPAIITNLKETILEKGDISEAAIKAALTVGKATE